MRYLQNIPQNKAEWLRLSGVRNMKATLLLRRGDISRLEFSFISFSCCCRHEPGEGVSQENENTKTPPKEEN